MYLLHLASDTGNRGFRPRCRTAGDAILQSLLIKCGTYNSGEADQQSKVNPDKEANKFKMA